MLQLQVCLQLMLLSCSQGQLQAQFAGALVGWSQAGLPSMLCLSTHSEERGLCVLQCWRWPAV